MSQEQQPFAVDILSDSDNSPPPSKLGSDTIDLITPSPFSQSKKKKQRIAEAFAQNPSNSTTVLIIDDDDPTPIKPIASTSSSSFVAETPLYSLLKSCSTSAKSGEGLATEQRVVPDTPMTGFLQSEVSVTKCIAGVSTSEPACSIIASRNSVEMNGLISVDSDDEFGNLGGFEAWKHKESAFVAKLANESENDSRLVESAFCLGSSTHLQEKPLVINADKMQTLERCSRPSFFEDDLYLARADSDDEANKLEPEGRILSEQDNNRSHSKGKNKAGKAVKPKGTSKEERLRLQEEKKQQKEQEKLLKAASKAEAAEMNKRKKEMQKWEKGKYALKSIVAEIDKKVVEIGSIGGHLLTRFAEKGLSYRITSNPVERTIVWTMVIPDEVSAIASERIEVSYVLIIYEAEEFCNLVMNGSFMDHVHSIQNRYPHHTICYLTNRLMAYINKREQAQYKNPTNCTGWKRPAIEEVLTKLATHFSKVHSRLCVDEAEVAEHVVGLTCSLASCQFRKKLTRLSVNANGSMIPKDCVDKNLIKKSLWLKALVAIPKVQPRFAIAIWKKYPTMKSLLSAYMDPTKSVHEKEFLLKDLITEGLLGDDRRVGEVCSKRIYRILMAQCGNIKTDDVEHGADFFSHLSG